MNQRIRMNHFNAAAEPNCIFSVAAQNIAHAERQARANAFPARIDTVFHCVMQ